LTGLHFRKLRCHRWPFNPYDIMRPYQSHPL
jgi:hypothetical protein